MIDGNSQRRNFVVRLATLFFVATLLEGAVRKWVVVFPPFEQGVLFVKDILIFVCLAYAIVTNRISTGSSLFVVFLAGTLISLILIVIQPATSFSVQSVILMYYGWRNYFLMIAMAKIVIDNFSEGDVRRIMRISFIVMMISAPLMIIQSALPPNHVFNAGFGEFTEDYFSNATFSAGIVRATGVFMAPPGNTTFILASGAFLLGALADGRRIVESSIAKLMVAVTFAVDFLYSGARTLFFVFPFILFFHLIALAIAAPDGPPSEPRQPSRLSCSQAGRLSPSSIQRCSTPIKIVLLRPRTWKRSRAARHFGWPRLHRVFRQNV